MKTELKKGAAPLLVLALLEHEQRHGYELTKMVQAQSNGVLKLSAASLYPLLYRMEKKGWIVGRWVERANERRRRYYRLTASGRRQLEAERSSWMEFTSAVSKITEARYA